MRWKERVWKHGDTRTIKRFLLFPRYVDGEWRWLELAEISQRLHVTRTSVYWFDLNWIDDQTQKDENGSVKV